MHGAGAEKIDLVGERALGRREDHRTVARAEPVEISGHHMVLGEIGAAADRIPPGVDRRLALAPGERHRRRSRDAQRRELTLGVAARLLDDALGDVARRLA